ncbi:Cinnamyl-alcohol dehydrogenase Flavonol reductase/cinnamoyl-CoA reductase [Rhodotorula toruloides]
MVDRSPRSPTRRLAPPNKLGTSNSDSLRDAFSQFGQAVHCIVMTEPGTGRSRGFGFVTFADQAAADAAIQTMNEQEL